jgi:hypothetical protein
MESYGGKKMRNTFYVHCVECQDPHLTSEVEFLNVEEDMQGRDIMYFVCPNTLNESKSLVYKE